MSNKSIFGLGILIILLIGGYLFFSAGFTANEYETNTFAAYEKEQAALTEFDVVVDLQAQVKLQTDSIDLAKLQTMFQNTAEKHGTDATSMTGANGTSGVLALMNVQSMPAQHDLAKQLMTTIEGKQAAYQEKQATRVDRDRTYQNYLKSSLMGMIASMRGFPTEAYKEKGLDRAITTSSTQKTYETKTLKPGKVFNRN